MPHFESMRHTVSINIRPAFLYLNNHRFSIYGFCLYLSLTVFVLYEILTSFFVLEIINDVSFSSGWNEMYKCLRLKFYCAHT